MFVAESHWIRDALGAIALPAVSQVLDVGSHTLNYRKHAQPHVDDCVFRPLRERGCTVTHLDVQEEVGVDVVFDFMQTTVEPVEALGMQFDLVICASMLTEVEDVGRAVARLKSLVRTGGYLLVAMPSRYRKYGPGDRMVRTSVKQLRRLLQSADGPRFEEVAATAIRVDDRDKYRVIYGTPNPLRRYGEVFRYWLRPLRWKVSCVLGRIL